MNTITLTGRLTRDPELRNLADGSVCKLRLAVERMGRANQTGYIDVATFGKQAEACAKVLRQGWLVAVDERLEYAEWKAKDDTNRTAHTVIGHVEFLAAPKASSEPAAAKDDIAI